MGPNRKQAPPVTLRRREIALQNSKWKVYRDDITGADGTRVDGYLVMAPIEERADRIAGVSVLPIGTDGRVGLLWNYRHPLDLFAWEAVRGFVDHGEDDIARAAMRELIEETGLVCDNDDLISLGTLAEEASTLAVRGALYAALNCRTQSAPQGGEPGLGELTFHTLNEVLALAERGEIQDANTLIALYRYALRRNID